MESNGLNVYQVQQMRDALDQAGQAGNGRIAGGLGVGSVGPAPGMGELLLQGSIRDSLAIGAAVQATADQSIPATTWTPITWAGVLWDTDGIWAAGSPGRLTVHSGGVYLFYAFAVWDTYAAGSSYLAMMKNGVEVVTRQDVAWGTMQPQSVCGLCLANEGDYFEAAAYNNTAGARNLKYYSYRPSTAGIVRVA